MPRNIPPQPEWLSVQTLGPISGVDRENKILRGYVVAQKGPFKTGRGEFDDQSLDSIVRLFGEHPVGLKSRFTHPDLSGDGLGKFLGRARNPRRDGDRVRADLHLDPSSFNTPHGNLGGYVLDLADSDPEAISSSLALKTDKEVRLNPNGTAKTDEKGDPLPPLWRPTQLRASDIVEQGDAVDGILSELSLDELPDALVRKGGELLDRAFPGQPRETVEARLNAWLSRYLERRYGPPPGRSTGLLHKKLKLKLLTAQRGDSTV